MLNGATSVETIPPPAPPARGRGEIFASPRIALALIAAVAVATRIVAWWNPVADIDDQFYILVGQELLKGHWPYVDVWDRKPLGLFLLHAGIGWLTGGSIPGLNFVATAFAIATAWVLRQTSLRFATPAGATFAALSYLVFLPMMYGQTGQTPVFYNLFMAGAGWLLFQSIDNPSLSNIRRNAFAAMLLSGLSIWIKQVAFVEGAFFGLSFLWLLHRAGEKPLGLIAAGAAMILIGLSPNLLGIIGYSLAGREALDTYVHANFISIFQRTSWGWHSRIAGMALFVLFLFPLVGMAIAGLAKRWKDCHGDLGSKLLLGWLVAAFLGYVIVPEFFPHYALPLLVPLCIAAAIFFSRTSGMLFFGAILAFCLIQGPVFDISLNRTSSHEYAQLSDAVNRARHGGCIYLADGPTRLYSTTGACTVTRYLFPDHLNIVTEAGAIGANADLEMAHILAKRPAVIVTQNRNKLRYSPTINAMLSKTLSRDYRLAYRTPKAGPKLIRDVWVWQRKDLAQNLAPTPTS